MKLVASHELIREGAFPASRDWERASSELRKAIAAVAWPPEGEGFFLDPNYDGSAPELENGVKPIKEAFQMALVNDGWLLEQTPRVIDEGGRPANLMRSNSYPKGSLQWSGKPGTFPPAIGP